MNVQDQLVQYQELALGSRLKRLSDQMMKEASKIYHELDIHFDPYLMPIFKLISEKDELTIGELSYALNVTQPAVTQFVNSLLKRKLITVKVGAVDKRKRKISLSKSGKKLLTELKPIWKIIDNEIKSVSHNAVNKTLLEHITYMETEFKKESFSTRVLKKMNSKDNITIIDFNDNLSDKFRDLNFEWLQKYFYIEDHDKEVLENAKTYIIDNGGFIFFAMYNDKVVGTVALVNEDEGYELSKMAVLPDYQGLKIGQQLMQHCIDFAKNKRWKELLLYSNTILKNAIYIYRKYGFEEVALESDNPYQRSDIKMVLKL